MGDEKRKPEAKHKARLVPPEREGRQAWTFSSSGWLFVYFFGVIQCLKELGLHRDVYVVGSSGGACAGTYLFLDSDIVATVEYIQECAEKARSKFINLFKIKEYVAGAIANFQPKGAGPALSGHVEISITTLPWFRNVRIKQFKSNEEVRDSILASAGSMPPPMYLPGYGWAMDGCFSDFQIFKAMFAGGNFLTMHSEDAISVCPFYMSRADIKPSKWIPPWWAAFPPRPQKLQELFRLGYDDTFAWLKDNGKLTPGLLLDSALASQQNGSVLNGCSRQTAAPGQKPRWHNLVAQTAMEAPSCDESLKDVMAGAWGLLRRLLGYVIWFLICWELFLSSCASLSSLGWSCLSCVFDGGDSFQQARKRFVALCKSSTISSWEVLKTVPWYNPQHIKVKDREVGRSLQEHSLLYRTFFFMLQ